MDAVTILEQLFIGFGETCIMFGYFALLYAFVVVLFKIFKLIYHVYMYLVYIINDYLHKKYHRKLNPVFELKWLQF